MNAIRNVKHIFIINAHIEPLFSDDDPAQIMGDHKTIKVFGINLYSKISLYGVPQTWDEWLSLNSSKVHALSKEIGGICEKLREIKKSGIPMK